MKQSAFLEQNPTARREHDFYETPEWMTHALLHRLRGERFGVFFEPCAGHGAIARLLPGDVYVNEPYEPLRAEGYRCQFAFDAADPQVWHDFFPVVDWVVTNPPFALADRIVPLAVTHARAGVAILLRLSWLEPTDMRQRFLAASPPTRLIVLPRYSFRGSGQTDSVTSAWFVWETNQVARRGVEIVTKMERDEWIARKGGAHEHVDPRRHSRT